MPEFFVKTVTYGRDAVSLQHIYADSPEEIIQIVKNPTSKTAKPKKFYAIYVYRSADDYFKKGH